MKRNFLLKILATIASILTISNAHAQRCGNGVYAIVFYTPNGVKLPAIDYELAPVDKADVEMLLQRSLLPVHLREHALAMVNGGLVLDPQLTPVDSLFAVRRKASLSETLADEKLFTRIKKIGTRMGLKPVRSPGRVSGPKLEFPTSETFYRLFLLRLTCMNRTVYVVGNFFGGCDYELYLYWNPYKGFRKFAEEY